MVGDTADSATRNLASPHAGAGLGAAGPAGLAAAVALRQAGIGPVVIAERDPEPGGVPRHTRHLGFGLRDLHRAGGGPCYAAAYAARALLLATGCRERPRAARLVPGDRPLGVLTTGMHQQLVHLQHQPVG